MASNPPESLCCFLWIPHNPPSKIIDMHIFSTWVLGIWTWVLTLVCPTNGTIPTGPILAIYEHSLLALSYSHGYASIPTIHLWDFSLFSIWNSLSMKHPQPVGATIRRFNLCVLDSSKATDVRRFVPAPAFSVLSRYLEVELLIHMEIQRLAIWTLARLFPTAAVWVLAPLAAHRNSIFSMSPPTPFLCLYFVLHEDVLMGGKWCGVQFDDGIADGHP